MNFLTATASYERWVASSIPLDRPALAFKHRQMALGLFPFFRATFYRWVQIWREVVGDAASAPSLLAVGDLHVENFGTWRDIEGRLIWGINDFDEVWPLPYTNDLIRLATSALLARMNCGARPFVLAEHHHVLRHMATARLHDPEPFWEKLQGLRECDSPSGAKKAIERLMPERSLRWRITHRIAGLGSLGRERY